MNIHVMPVDKFTNDFIAFINSHYDISENYFYLYADDPLFKIDNFSNVKYIDHFSNEIDLSLLCRPKDKLVIHSFILAKVNKFLYYNIDSLDFNRIVLVIWGGDVYNSNLLDSMPEWLVQVENMKKTFIPKVKMFMTFACADYDYVREMYGADGMQFDCLYPSSVDKKLLDSIKIKRNEKKVVQIGNSATFTNQHKEILKDLHRYKGRITVMCPLSYGETDYRDEIIDYGKTLFGSDFLPVTEYLAPEKYAELLAGVDVAVFNNNRQQATANIEILAYLGKKIYLRDDTSLWSHYVVRDACSFYSISDMKEQSLGEFTAMKKEDSEKNKAYFKNIWDDTFIKSKWDAVFNLVLS